MDGQVSPLLEDAHVLARERASSEGVVGAVFGGVCLRRGGGMALEALEPCTGAAVLALDGLLVVPVRQVGIRRRVHFAFAVGLGLDSLDAGTVIVAVFALRHGSHCGGWASSARV